MDEQPNGINDSDGRTTHSLEIEAELHRLDARFAQLRAEVTNRQHRIARIMDAYCVLKRAAKLNATIDYSTLTQAANCEGVDLGPVLDVLDEEVVDVPEWVRCDTISSSF